MAEPTSSIITAGVVAALVGLFAWISKLDPEAVGGAFMGSIIFALTAKDTSRIPRIIYSTISLVVGYAAVPDVVVWTPVKVPLIASFLVSAVIVHTLTTVIDRIKTMSIRGVWDAVMSTFKKGV